MSTDQPERATPDTTLQIAAVNTWPHQRLRSVMHGALLTIAVVVAIAGGIAWQGEQQRTLDAELINLAGGQRMLSQRLALLGTQPPADDGQALKQALHRAQNEAMRIDDLLGAGNAARLAALPSQLAEALQRWQTTRELLWSQAHTLARLVTESDAARRTRAAKLLLDAADDSLVASEALVAALHDAADSKAADAQRHLLDAAAALATLLLALAMAVVEPTARFVRRQHARVSGVAAQLEQLSLVARHTQNTVIITDLQRRIVWVNDAFSRATGYTLAEAVGSKPADLLQTSTTDPAEVLRLRNALDAGQGVRVELVNRGKTGPEYWVDIDIQPLFDAAGVLTGFISVQTDITHQVYQRQRLLALLDALPAGVLEYDASGTIIESNRAAAQVLCLSRDQLRGRNPTNQRWRNINDDLSPCPSDQQPSSRSLRDGSSVRGASLGVLTPQGEQRWLLINSEPLRNPAGEVTGAVACFVDVTEQRAQRTLLQLALSAANIGTWDWRLQDGPPVWSAVCCGQLGYSIDEWAQLTASQHTPVHPDDLLRATRVLHEHLADPRNLYHCDLRLRHRDGQWVWLQAFGSVVERDVNGRALRMVGLHIDIGERKRFEQQLQTSALSDALTGLPNRAALLQRLAALVDRHRVTPGGHFGLLFLDFDRFKQVNDSLGHGVGDELLRQIGQRLVGTLRPGDAIARSGDAAAPAGTAVSPPGQDGERTAARLGGDEFVVLLDGLQHSSDAAAVADRLLQVLSRPYDIQGHRVHSSVSIGLVTSDLPFDDADSLLRDADTAMYEAKQSGRGRWVMFEPRMHQRVSERASIEVDLHNALERNELFVAYQPVLALGDPQGLRGCAGVEALVRWRHPERGVVPPLEFVPVAEECGLIGALGLFVLQSACCQFMRWQRDLGPRAPALLAVNLSIAQLRQDDLVAQVQRTLADNHMPAAALQLEVTESLAAQDPLAQARLRELKALGLTLALDDFGTGYSSLACLHQLPVDTVKIDRSFVMEAERSEYHRALIEATVRVARTLRMATVAEGIETTAQAALITALGCDRGQGYLYSRPLEAAALTNWLAARATPAPLASVHGPELALLPA